MMVHDGEMKPDRRSQRLSAALCALILCIVPITGTVMILVIPSGSVHAYDPPPNHFSGTVTTTGGVPAPVNLLVRAEVDGVPYGSGFTFDAGATTNYSFDVEGDDGTINEKDGATAGELIIFWVSDYICNETATWEEGIHTELSLSYTPVGQPALLKINEFMVNPEIGEEWVELYNPTGNPVDLANYSLADNDGWSLQLSGIIPAMGWNLTYLGATAHLLNTGQDELKLVWTNPTTYIAGGNDVVIDRVEYGPPGYMPDDTKSSLGYISNTPLPDSNVSLELEPDGNDNDDPEFDFTLTATPTPGYANNATLANNPPVASNLNLTPVEPKTTDELIATYDYSDPDGDPEFGTRIRWYCNGKWMSAYNNFTILPATATTKGESWHFTVMPRDGKDFGTEQESPPRTIINSAPTAIEVAIVPTVPITTDDLVAVYTYVDADNDPESGTEIRWYLNGVLQPAYNDTLIIPATATTKWQLWNFTVRPCDGEEFGTLVTSPTIMIENALPIAINVSIIPAEPTPLEDLTAYYEYYDADGDLESGTELRWYKDGVLQPALNDSIVVDATNTAAGEFWYFTVKPSDGTAFGDLEVSASVVINTPPVAYDLTLTPLYPLDDDDLVASYSVSDPDGNNVSVELRWYRNGVYQPAFDNQLVVPASYTTLTDLWNFTVLPFDGYTYGDLQVSPTVYINTPPSVADLTITPGAPSTTDNLVASYTYTDPEGNAESGTELRWYKDGVLQIAYNDTFTIPYTATTDGEQWYFTVRPKDGYNFGFLMISPTVTIGSGNTAPTAYNLTIYPSAPYTTDDLMAIYGYVDPDDNPENEALREIRWFMDDVLQPAYNDLLVVPASATAKGQKWYYTLRVHDGTDYSALTISWTITIVNMPPSVINVTILPATPYTIDDLVASYEYYDADGDPESGTVFEWYKNDNLQSGLTTDTVSAAYTAKGQVWKVNVIPSDGTDFGVPANASVTILNSPPVIVTLKIRASTTWSETEFTPEDDLVLDYYASDADWDTITIESKWYKNGEHQAEHDNSDIVSATYTSAGETWYVEVRVTDGTDYSAWETSQSIVINIPPYVTDVTLTPIGPRAIDYLVATYTYVDDDGDPESGTILEWYRNGTHEPAYDTIDAHSPVTLPATATSPGELWYFIVKPKDGISFGTPVQSITVTIQLPAAMDLALTPGAPTTEMDLHASYSYIDPEGTLESGTIVRWYKVGVATVQYEEITTEAEGSTLPSSYTAKGETWYFTVTPCNGTAYGHEISSLSYEIAVTILNTPPSPPGVSIIPDVPTTLDDLICNIITPSTDPDEDTITYFYSWYKDGVLQTLLTTNTVGATYTTKGELWRCVVVAFDGENYSAEAYDEVTIANAPPSVTDATITPSVPYTQDTLNATYTFVDPDDDLDLSYIEWYRDGSHVPEFDGQLSVPPSATAKGQQWYYQIIPYDGTAAGTLTISTTVTIQNSPPTVTELYITPAEPVTTDVLWAIYNYTDPDGDPASETLTELCWYCNDVLQPAYNNTNPLPASATTKGQIWHFTIRPSDGDAYGELQTSTPVEILNTPPEVSEVAISPPMPTTTDKLIAHYIYEDPDGDPEVGRTLQWFMNDELQIAFINVTEIPPTATTKGQVWYFTIQSFDGEAFSTLAQAEPVTILNSPPVVTNVEILPTAPTTLDALAANYTYTDADADLETGTEIRWYRDGTLVTELNDLTLVDANFTARGEEWYFTIRPFDGEVFGTLVEAEPVVIGNAPPVVTNVAIQPEVPTTLDNLVATYTYHDPDGDPESGTKLRWYLNGKLQSAYNDKVQIPASITQEDQCWHFTVEPSDGITFGTIVASAPVIIQPPPIPPVIDTDGDGVPDDEDAFPEDPTQWLDSDGDGYGDNITGNNPDMFPDDPTEWNDLDGDGYGDNSDAFPQDPTEWQDTDGDSYGDNSDAFPQDPTEWCDFDNDGQGDNADPDDDNDNMPDDWELKHEFNPRNATDAEEDADSDGYTNREECEGDSNPRDPESIPVEVKAPAPPAPKVDYTLYIIVGVVVAAVVGGMVFFMLKKRKKVTPVEAIEVEPVRPVREEKR